MIKILCPDCQEMFKEDNDHVMMFCVCGKHLEINRFVPLGKIDILKTLEEGEYWCLNSRGLFVLSVLEHDKDNSRLSSIGTESFWFLPDEAEEGEYLLLPNLSPFEQNSLEVDVNE